MFQTFLLAANSMKKCENIDLDDYDNFLAHFVMFMHIYVVDLHLSLVVLL